jgi:hypothetical protein
MARILTLLLCVALSGCASLIIRDHDTAATTTGKVATRVILAPITLGMSEVFIADAKGEEQCMREGGWWFLGACRAPEARRDALYLAPAFMQSIQRYQAPVQAYTPPAPSYTTPNLAPNRFNCTSQQVGTTTYTNCQ